MKTIGIFICFLALACSCHGAELSPHAYLRKLSLHLKGVDPTMDEHRLLDAAVSNRSQKTFFSEKIKEYLATEQHVEKMNFRLNELFWMRNSPLPQDLAKEEKRTLAFEDQNSMNALFREIVRKNLSWDLLLTSKKYSVYQNFTDSEHHFRIYDMGFYSAIKSLPPTYLGNLTQIDPTTFITQSSDAAQPFEIQFANDDERVAGSVTTSRFFEHYTNTAQNKNRRRAAAIFRIFLCEPMMPVVVAPDDAKKKQLLDLYMGQVHNGDQQNSSNDLIVHGTQPECMKCHSMLDPMGKTFQAQGVVLSDEPSQGALYYKNADGTEVNVPVKGIGSLAQAIVNQPKYSQCQVSHFVQWFFGYDMNLNADRLIQINQKFESLGRKPNDFITYLVSQPEFREKPQAPTKAITFLSVKPIFQQCASCHSQSDVKAADFSRLPFENKKGKTDYWVERIALRLDLAHQGKNATMPPTFSSWKPAPDDLALIQKWIDAGAPDEKGLVLISRGSK